PQYEMSAIPDSLRYASALRAIPRGSRVYHSPVTGSLTKQLMLTVGCSRKESTYAESGSGTRSMSDSWISWNPRIDEPSKPRPSSKLSSENSDAGTEKCCIKPGRSQNRTSTTCAPESLINFSVSRGLAMQ